MLKYKHLFIVMITIVAVTTGKKNGQLSHLQGNITKTKRDVQPHIVRGSITPVKTAVAILIETNGNKDLTCSGTVISNTWVMTAGHCVKDVDISLISIVAAEMDMREYWYGQSNIAVESCIKSVKLHPKYNVIVNQVYDWDVALLELDDSLEIDSNPNIEAAQVLSCLLQQCFIPTRK